MLLAIDTTTALTGLALADARGPLAECVWESGATILPSCYPNSICSCATRGLIIGPYVPLRSP